MGSGEVPLVTVTIALDVLLMFGTKLLNGHDDLSIASILTHGCRGEVGVAACSIQSPEIGLGSKVTLTPII